MRDCRSRKSRRLVVVIGLMIFAAGCRSASPRTGQIGVLDHAMNRLERLVLQVVALLLVAVVAALLMMHPFFRRPQTSVRP